jgi:hypothetical protein
LSTTSGARAATDIRSDTDPFNTKDADVLTSSLAEHSSNAGASRSVVPCLPDRLHMLVTSQVSILRHEVGAMEADRRDNHLIGRIPMKRLR